MARSALFEFDDLVGGSAMVQALTAAARPLLRHVSGLGAIESGYASLSPDAALAFESRVLRQLDISVTCDGLDGVPRRGPVIVAANHPTGIRDGLALLEAVRSARPDARILANRLLARIPELRPRSFFVDVFAGGMSAARSHGGLRAALRWLHDGGCLIVFPAGAVAPRLRDRAGSTLAVDGPWHRTIQRLALAAKAEIVPALLDGHNSRTFYLAGRIHPLLRTLLLPRELMRLRGTTARVTFGPPLCPGAAAGDVTSQVRAAVDALRPHGAIEPGPGHPIVDAVDPVLLERDVLALPPAARLLATGAFDVYCAGADLLPHVLREIGRLREVSFRAVGEGTGQPIDLDRFDAHYRHLFVWHRTRREVVGAYRLAVADDIVRDRGVAGLYTRTLFTFDERLLERMGPSVELGRSFVRAEYQRAYSPLLLLWKGLGRFLAETPRCRTLFGAVSISSRYGQASQDAMCAFLGRHRAQLALAPLVGATNPPLSVTAPSADVAQSMTVDELDSVVMRLEGTRGLPVLLRHYLGLDAKLLGFNVDRGFANALDALMVVDLDELPAATLRRYLGLSSTDITLPRASIAA